MEQNGREEAPLSGETLDEELEDGQDNRVRKRRRSYEISGKCQFFEWLDANVYNDEACII
jgi:hypothetical protein